MNYFKGLLRASILAAVIVAGATGCDEDNPAPAPGEDDDVLSIEIAENGIYATSATFALQLSGVDAYAYEVEAGEAAEELPLGEIIFSNASEEGGTGVIDAVKGQNDVSIYGLEGASTYTVYFAFRTGTEIEVHPHTFTTPEYTDLITMISADWFSMKFHIEAPADMYYKYGLMSADMYYMMKGYGLTDIDFVDNNPLRQGPVTEELVAGTEDEDGNALSITPGTAYFLILCECDADGNIMFDYNGGGGDIDIMSVAPDLGDYTTEYPDDYLTFTGRFARLQFWTRQPEQHEHCVRAEQIKLTAKRAQYRFTPTDESVRQYGIAILSSEEYDQYVQWVGEKGMVTFLVNNLMQPFAEAQEIEWEFADGYDDYKLFVIAAYNENSTLMSSEVIDVHRLQSELPETDLQIEHVETPDDAFNISFRVKAPNKDAAGIRYVMNYTSEWNSLLNPDYGIDEAYVLSYYGQDITDSEVLAGINSDEGFIMTFSTTEQTESMLAVASYNADEVLSKVYTATGTSAEDWGDIAKGEESELLTTLAGDWTATYTYSSGSASATQNTASFKVSLAGGPDAGPDTFTARSEGYQSLVDYWTGNGRTEAEAETLIAQYFAEYKELAQHYADKYASHNRLVACGFSPIQDYKGTWDLFLDTDYVSYTTDELFNDYGPKFFIEVDSDGGLSTVTNPDRIAPLSSWASYAYYLFGYSRNPAGNVVADAFPTELSGDNSTITVNPYEYNGGLYYPSVGYYMSGTYRMLRLYGASPIVLTKGWKESASSSSAAVRPAARTGKIGAYRGGNRFMKIRLPYAGAVKVLPRTEYDIRTMNDIAAGYREKAESLKK